MRWPCAEIGFASTCLENLRGATFAGFLIRARPKNNLLNPEFAGFYFRAACHRPFFIREMNIVTRASLSQGLLSNLPVLIPSKQEQAEIYLYLNEKCSKIDSLIKTCELEINKLTEYRSSLITAAVTGKLNLDEVNE